MNLLQVAEGRLLASLSEGGFRHLAAGARAGCAISARTLSSSFCEPTAKTMPESAAADRSARRARRLVVKEK